jgi:hypothetical protein
MSDPHLPPEIQARLDGAAEERADTVAFLRAIVAKLEKTESYDARFIGELADYIESGVQRGASWGRQ